MSDERLFDIEEFPEVPILRPPRARKSEGDARFKGEYPPEWDTCTTCFGRGKLDPRAHDDDGHYPEFTLTCHDCLGMGSLKAHVRLEAGHRCIRCQHPYIPKGDAKMLSQIGARTLVWPTGYEPCDCGPISRKDCPRCKGTGLFWKEGWSPCDERCEHGGPLRARLRGSQEWSDVDGFYADSEWTRWEVEAAWRILTVHHADGDKSNVRWWNLLSLCQRCHLEIQSKVVMERVYIHEHSEWFKPFVAGYYAFVYLCGTCGLRFDDPNANHRGRADEVGLPRSGGSDSGINENGVYPHPFVGLELTRPEVEGGLDELLDLERVPA